MRFVGLVFSKENVNQIDLFAMFCSGCDVFQVKVRSIGLVLK